MFLSRGKTSYLLDIGIILVLVLLLVVMEYVGHGAYQHTHKPAMNKSITDLNPSLGYEYIS
jgi:hypothetical protein